MDNCKKKPGLISSLFKFAGEDKEKIWTSIALSIVSIVLGIFPYYCFYRIVEQFMYEAVTNNVIWMWGGIALLCYVIKVICFGLSTTTSHIAAYHILENLRMRVADRFLNASLGETSRYSIGQVKGIIVDKIEGMEPSLAHIIPEGAGHLILPLVSFIALLILNWKIALASLVTLPLSIVFMGIAMKISGRNFDKYNQSNAEMNSNIVEYIEGIEVIKAFGQTGVSYEKYSNSIKEYRKFVIEWLSSTWVPMKLAFSFFPSVLLGVLPVGLSLCTNGSITAAQLALAVMLSMSMVTSLAKFEVFANEIKNVQLTIEELQAFLDIPELPEEKAPVEIKKYDVVLSDVRFAYDETEILHNVSITLPEGSFTALVGPSGGGKSTVARLISRFYDVTGGSILIGGADIRTMPLDKLADIISFVAQDNFLFRCSLKENIRIGNPKATDEEVYIAARAAQCEEFIQKLPKGYDTSAGEAGKRLSGGEKQRIAIARMILKNAPILILDEATAFTDIENEDKIQKSIMALTKGKTLLVIAHRLSTIKNADNIVVLNKGKVEAQGTQEQLLLNCPLYLNMWKKHIGAKNWAVGEKKEAGLNV